MSFKCIRTISQSVVSFDHFLAFPIESFIWLLFFSCERFVLVYPWIWIFTVYTLHSKNHFVKWYAIGWCGKQSISFIISMLLLFDYTIQAVYNLIFLFLNGFLCSSCLLSRQKRSILSTSFILVFILWLFLALFLSVDAEYNRKYVKQRNTFSFTKQMK